MKYYLVELDRRLSEQGLDYKFVGNIHDEVQMEVKEEHAELASKIAVECFKTVEKQLNWRCQLDGESKIGNNWEDTH